MGNGQVRGLKKSRSGVHRRPLRSCGPRSRGGGKIGRTGQRFGADDPLSSLFDTADLSFGNARCSPQLGMELGYGFRTGNALLTPYTDVFLSQGSNAYSAGLRYDLDSGMNLELEGTHRTRTSGNNDNRIQLQLQSDF